MNDNDDMPRTNIFGVVVNTDKEMEEKAPSLDISDEDEIEEAGFNPFSNNLFATDAKSANLRVGDEQKPKENIEIFNIPEADDEDDENNEETDKNVDINEILNL